MGNFAFRSGRADPARDAQVESALSDFKKSKWHYDRAGIVTKKGEMAKKRPGTFEGGIANDFRGMLKLHGIDPDENKKSGDWYNSQGSYRPSRYSKNRQSEK